jgi:iron complex outermembrane receptor protein
MSIHFSRKLCAVALSLAFHPAFAATTEAGTVIITGNRFSGSDRSVPANVTTLTREMIADTPAGNLTDLLATRAGVDVRSLYGNQAADSSVALRGFGENASLRTLVLVDGRRLDQFEFTTPNWASIPLDSIERIEIVRGSGSVLYGDQAVAGVINILTRRGQENSADVALTTGSFGTRKLSASISRNDAPLRYALSATHAQSDEYRDNNAHRNSAGSARLARDLSSGEIYAEAGAGKLRYGLPGAVTAAQFASNPRAAETNDSWFERENRYLRPGGKWLLSPNLEAAAELGLEESLNRSWISGWGSYREVSVKSLGFSPRLRWAHGLGAFASETVAGLDWSDATLDQDQAAMPGGAFSKRVPLERQSTAIYLSNTTRASNQVSITIGTRQQRMHTRASDTTLTTVSDQTAQKTAADLGIVWQPAAAWKLFAKSSSTFRYPVLDELTTWGGFAIPAARPESGRGADIGAEWRSGEHSLQVTHYDLKMTDEIAWSNASFQNENLQKTRHRGIEVDSRWKLAPDWHLDLAWTGKTATFREGLNNGNSLPLVPETRWTTMLGWNGKQWGKHALLANHVGSRYFGGDDANALARLPAYTTFDWQSRWAIASWELSAMIANLTNLKYASLGFDYGFGAAYYPANTRSINLTARYRF